jgi:hypothetical protein
MDKKKDKEETTLGEALNRARAKFKAVVKTADNPYFKSKYADLTQCLEAVIPALTEEGITLTQPILDGKVHTVISKNGEMLEAVLALPEITDPQKIGSAITYYRRYTLTALLALAAEDDDANTVSQGKKVEAPIQKKPAALEVKQEGTKVYHVNSKQRLEVPDEKVRDEVWYRYDLSSISENPNKLNAALKYMEDAQKKGALIEAAEGFEYLSDTALERFINLEVK